METLHLVGKARKLFGDTIHVGDTLPHVRTREKGTYTCPKSVNIWRKPINKNPYYHNDWLVGCPVCHTMQWRFAKCRGGWSLRKAGISTHLLPLCPVETREDLLMLTDCRFPSELCPWTIDEENSVLVDKHGKAELLLTNNFWNAGEGYRINLRANRHFWMGSGREERKDMEKIAKQCPKDAKVLVGGLGLGIVVLELCKQKPKFIQIWENNRDVAKLVYPKLTQWCEQHYNDVELELVVGDVRGARDNFDFVFYDIWDSAEQKHASLVGEMREGGERLIAENGKVICWQEERIMGKDKNINTALSKAVDDAMEEMEGSFGIK